MSAERGEGQGEKGRYRERDAAQEARKPSLLVAQLPHSPSLIGSVQLIAERGQRRQQAQVATLEHCGRFLATLCCTKTKDTYRKFNLQTEL